MSIVGVFDLTVSATPTLILRVPGNQEVKRITMTNRGAVDVVVRLWGVEFNTIRGATPADANAIIWDVNIFPAHTEILGPDDINIGNGDEIWFQGTSAGVALSIVMMT